MSKKIMIDLDENILEHITAKDVPLELFDEICRSIEKGKEIPEGEWIPHYLENILWGHNECPFCHKRSNRLAEFCQYCGAYLTEPKE